MPPAEPSATQNTPLAPSVEKAYYRKCIELKRRLNEVEASNDEMKNRRVRLDRAIMKMRLERAFLLEQLNRRMEPDVDGSEGSGDDGMATNGHPQPPPERPHRDKRRRTGGHSHPPAPSMPEQQQSHHSHHPQQQQVHSPYAPQQLQRLEPDYPQRSGVRPMVPGPNNEMVVANAQNEHGQPIYVPPEQLAGIGPPRVQPNVYGPQHGSPYGAPVGVPGATVDRERANGHPHGRDGAADEREMMHASRDHEREMQREREHEERHSRASGAGAEALSAGQQAMREDGNGERRVVGEGSADQMDAGGAGGGGGGGGFTAVNQ